MEFDREVPVEIGGDLVGVRRELDARLSPESVSLVDWSKLSLALSAAPARCENPPARRQNRGSLD
jgi:hypothetical protein